MQKQKRTARGTFTSIAAIIVILIIFSVVSVRLILTRMRSYIETNGANNMATIMEQLSQSYDIQVNAYFGNLEQTEKFLFQNGKRDLSREDFSESFDAGTLVDAEDLLFMKDNGEVMTTDGQKSRIDLRSQMIIDLDQGRKIVQSITLNSNIRKGNYFLIAIPCETYTVDGEEYSALAALYDRKNIDSMLGLNGYGGEAYIFLVDESGIVTYTNQQGDVFYRNFAVLKQLRKDKAISDAQYDALADTVKNGGQKVELFDENDAPFYLGCYPVTSSNHRLICMVARSTVNNSLMEYQSLVVRLIVLYMGVVLLLCIGLIYNIFRVNIFNRKMAYEEEKRQLQEKAMKELEMERNRANEANRAKSDFLANMSHDIRTPMNAIVGITNLMEHEGGLSERLYGYIQKIKLSSHHLLSLINDVLDMSKIEASEVELNVEPIRLAEQVGQVDSIIRSQTNERGQTFRILLHEVAHEHLLGDSTRLRQVFLNLLSNAVKYTPNGGAVTFEISELAQRVPGIAEFSFKVTDTGCGMTPEFMAHVFEPFTRAENSVTNKVPGTGLGMAITKNIIDLMGGTITVTSKVNEGSCFEAKIPLRIDPNVQCTLKGKKILLVSDDERLIRNIQAVVQENELVMEVLEPKRALHLSPGSVKADIILLAGYLMDCGLSQLVETLRKADASAQMVFCVDYAQKDQVQEILQHAGVDGLIARPFFLTGLEMAVDRVRSSASLNAGGQSPLEGMRFLCAEDNALNAEILEAILEMYGATCKIYPDGEEIVKAFEEVKPGEYDAILMDIQMPHMDGYEATRRIRNGSNPLGKTFPIIAMTANAFSDDVQHSLEAGMNAHVAKPIDLTVLEKTIRGLHIERADRSQT